MRKSTSFILKGLFVVLFSFTTFSIGFNMALPPSLTYTISYNEKEIEDTANQYLSVASYSQIGLIEALSEYEHFDKEKVSIVVRGMNIDWQEQADAELERYLHSSGYSERQVRKYLKRDKFTDKQINKAMKNISPDWREQAKKCRESLLNAGVGQESVNVLLKARGFSDEQIG